MTETKEAGLATLHFLAPGLLGFENLLEFELSVYDPQTPFYRLQSLTEPEIEFLVMEPACLLQDYVFDLSEEDVQQLQIEQPEDVFVLVLLTVPENPLEMTANLLGPLVFNRRNWQGKQLVLDGQNYPLRYPVLTAEEVADAGSEP